MGGATEAVTARATLRDRCHAVVLSASAYHRQPLSGKGTISWLVTWGKGRPISWLKRASGQKLKFSKGDIITIDDEKKPAARRRAGYAHREISLAAGAENFGEQKTNAAGDK